MRTQLYKNDSILKNEKFYYNNISNSQTKSLQSNPYLTLHNNIGNQATGRFLQMHESSNTNSTENVLQRQTYSDDGMLQDLPPTMGCECDCESYAREVARFYADRHLVYPSWTGGPRRRMPLDIYWWHCHHFNRTPGSCTWTAIVVFENQVTKTKYSVFVQLVNSSKIHVGTHSESFPLCTYDFECDSSGNYTRLELTELICRDRTIFREL